MEAESVKKYEYKYVTVELGGIFSGAENNMWLIQQHITQNGNKGWRYAGWFPVENITTRTYDYSFRNVQLIFEKEIEE